VFLCRRVDFALQELPQNSLFLPVFLLHMVEIGVDDSMIS
jgi:hypothetical protein